MFKAHTVANAARQAAAGASSLIQNFWQKLFLRQAPVCRARGGGSSAYGVTPSGCATCTRLRGGLPSLGPLFPGLAPAPPPLPRLSKPSSPPPLPRRPAVPASAPSTDPNPNPNPDPRSSRGLTSAGRTRSWKRPSSPAAAWLGPTCGRGGSGAAPLGPQSRARLLAAPSCGERRARHVWFESHPSEAYT